MGRPNAFGEVSWQPLSASLFAPHPHTHPPSVSLLLGSSHSHSHSPLNSSVHIIHDDGNASSLPVHLMYLPVPQGLYLRRICSPWRLPPWRISVSAICERLRRLQGHGFESMGSGKFFEPGQHYCDHAASTVYGDVLGLFRSKILHLT